MTLFGNMLTMRMPLGLVMRMPLFYVVLVLLPAVASSAAPVAEGTAFGIASRIAPRAYLNMPRLASGNMPPLLSQTGAFVDAAGLRPGKGLIPYDLIVAFWSDGARKSRMVAVPRGGIEFSSTGEWKFPDGTVFVKTFFLPTDATQPRLERRLETRILVRDSSGGVYGVTYKWRPDGSDADLLPGSLREEIPVRAADGTLRQQTWYYPSRQDCRPAIRRGRRRARRQVAPVESHDFAYPSGVSDNELRTWNHLGLFTRRHLAGAELATLPALAAADDTSRSLEDRARSYLDANCSQCHRPGGTVANFDARYDTPLSDQALIDGPVLIDQGIDRPRVISPNDIWRSIAFMRVNSVGDIQMPPLARETIDTAGVKSAERVDRQHAGAPGAAAAANLSERRYIRASPWKCP
jgi:mono/diheme cytochrome c family protein